MTVFLQLITEYTPKAAKSLPIIGLYFNVNLILVLTSVVLTIIVLNFHFRGPKKQRVPKWMRKYIIGYIGRVFCFCHESRAFFLAQQQETRANKITINKLKNELPVYNLRSKSDPIQLCKGSAESLNNNIDNELDYLNKQSEPAYLKSTNRNSNRNLERNEVSLKENSIVFNDTKAVEGEVFLKSSGTTSESNKAYANSINQSLSSRSKTKHLALNSNHKTDGENPFNEEISKNLEKMLIKLQKSFDPFKLQDENLKFAILKEILECQRLLLTANLANKKDKQITVNEIYDEWKILAMIVDRICFFIYLSALIASSVLFFLSEQIYDDSNG